ncbi:MAG TPA: nutrient deprivation-induced protein [Devosia sp.]|jgi:hypothetical protein|uniref:DUF3618 domain-containing protein n=1 Tax=Devosia sp. TaxID=1871048 RepID=UPI002DDC9645|nr:nutrient deprivation-induced protein [Devosia sp.]HEV2518060.1 nutrient deprivation-induced protein [Devosia sp.]
MSSFGKDSAQLEQEVEEQRRRVEDRIGEIRERLSPGQLVDEVLSYTKDGGMNFAAGLGNTITANPLPAALLGISLVWLMSGKGTNPPTSGEPRSAHRHEPEYPYATATGGRMRRISHGADDMGRWRSEFEDAGGKRYKAESNELGHRLGAFVDDAGRKFGGFIDEAGHRVSDFQDEAGNKLEEATGWASHRWHDVQAGVGAALEQAGQQAQHLASGTQHQLNRAGSMVGSAFNSQPLVAGALAFAAGAALGATLPHTAEEDKLLGKAGDKTRREAAGAASDLYEAGKEKAAELYDKGKEGATQLYDELRETPRGVH